MAKLNQMITWIKEVLKMFSNDPLGDICTEEEVKFLSEVLFEAWFALDVRNMSTKKRKMYSSINSKIRRLNNAK